VHLRLKIFFQNSLTVARRYWSAARSHARTQPAGRLVALLALLFFAGAQPASAGPWSVTLYGGPATYVISSEVIQGNFNVNAGVIGVAADRRLAYLGWGWNLVGEGQFQVFAGKHSYPSVSLGLGLEFHDFPWEQRLPTALSVFMGPSYSVDPYQYYATNLWGSRKSLLNYVSIEVAVALPDSHRWDVALRTYHRSGAWGFYTLDADEATVIGAGVRYRF